MLICVSLCVYQVGVSGGWDISSFQKTALHVFFFNYQSESSHLGCQQTLPFVFGSEGFWSVKGDVCLQKQRKVGHVNSLRLQQLQGCSLSFICTYRTQSTLNSENKEDYSITIKDRQLQRGPGLLAGLYYLCIIFFVICTCYKTCHQT